MVFGKGLSLVGGTREGAGVVGRGGVPAGGPRGPELAREEQAGVPCQSQVEGGLPRLHGVGCGGSCAALARTRPNAVVCSGAALHGGRGLARWTPCHVACLG